MSLQEKLLLLSVGGTPPLMEIDPKIALSLFSGVSGFFAGRFSGSVEEVGQLMMYETVFGVGAVVTVGALRALSILDVETTKALLDIIPPFTLSMLTGTTLGGATNLYTRSNR